jgi:hypothetical protein
LQNVSNKIQLWVKGNYDSAMRFVAYTELAILARTAVGAVLCVSKRSRRSDVDKEQG